MKHLLFSILIFANINLYANFLNNLTKEEQSAFKFVKDTLKNPNLDFEANEFFKNVNTDFMKIEYNEDFIIKFFNDLGKEKTKTYLNTLYKTLNLPKIKNEKDFQDIIRVVVYFTIYKQLRPKTKEFYDNSLLLFNLVNSLAEQDNIFSGIFMIIILLQSMF
ncbi:hypothetical protein [Borreliella tanukii]|uniref:hypothetical protein n=1 Tax=Borreliella tanukii TaxID=56146 RepID=UPI003AF07A10